jgi:hypothetical protein
MKIIEMITVIGILCLISLSISCKEVELPALTTAVVTDITTNSALSGGMITSAGSGDIIARGVCWSTSNNPTIEDNTTSDGTGIGGFESTIPGLLSDKVYRLRAYATNSIGTAYGNEEEFKTARSDTPQGSQIIADHTVVDKYDDIPQYYIDQVKKMWLVIAGESHSRGYFSGLELLEALDSRYQVNWTQSGTPEAYTTSHLRTSRATWGDVNNSTGWIYLYGEEDWWTTPAAIAQTKAGIKYCHDNNLKISVFGFGHCYDDGVNYTDYCTATDDYIAYCKANGYSTRIIFTTNVVDGYASLKQYNRSLGADLIRAHVNGDEDRILFDYADILCYDDGSDIMNTAVYDGHTFQIISDNNRNPEEDYHISEAGAVRLAKAMWWLLARIAGWDGN